VRYIKYLIEQVRRETENEEFTDETGIKDNEFIQYLNDAQHRLQARITSQHPRVFLNDELINVVSGQSTYNLPSDTYLDNRVHNIEYSSTGNESDYYILDEVSLRRISPGASGEPSYYVRSTGKIIINPVPTTGTFRITYTQKLKELDLRIGRVVSTQDTVTSIEAITEISLDPSPVVDVTSGQEHDFICVVDRFGNSKMKNIPVNISVTTDLPNIDSDSISVDPHTPLLGESIEAGDYIIGGKDSSSHSQLPRSVERYLIQYCAWKILKRDSSVDSQEAQAELLAMEDDITSSYANITDDIQNIPVLTDWEDWSL